MYFSILVLLENPLCIKRPECPIVCNFTSRLPVKPTRQKNMCGLNSHCVFENRSVSVLMSTSILLHSHSHFQLVFILLDQSETTDPKRRGSNLLHSSVLPLNRLLSVSRITCRVRCGAGATCCRPRRWGPAGRPGSRRAGASSASRRGS